MPSRINPRLEDFIDKTFDESTDAMAQLPIGMIQPSLLPFEETPPLDSQPPPISGSGKRLPKNRQSGMDFINEKARQALARKANGESNAVDPNSEASVSLQTVFPTIDDDQRVVPNLLARSGLFSTRRSSVRERFQNEKIASLTNIEVYVSGEDLRQDDLTVWLACVSMGRGKRLGDRIYFSGYQLIKDMNWRVHSDSYNSLRESIKRLRMNEIRVNNKRTGKGYAGGLLRDYGFDGYDADDVTGKWWVRFEPNIASLFLFEDTTLFYWRTRVAIGNKASLALFLHQFYSTHKEPLPYSVKKLHELARSEAKTLSGFETNLKRALEKLVTVEFLESFEIRDGMVHVKRSSAAKMPRISS